MGAVLGDPAIDRDGTISRLVIDRLFRELGEFSHEVEVQLWNGEHVRPTNGYATRSRLILRHPGALRAMLWPPNAQTLGEAYIYDDFDVEGEIEPILSLIDGILASASDRNRLGRLLLALPDSSNARRAGRREPVFVPLDGASSLVGRNALLYRPNLGNAFYACWLGRDMSFYPGFDTTPVKPDQAPAHDQAERSMFDRLYARLALRPDETLLDLTAGWGSLVIDAASRHGIRAAGICQSLDQFKLARRLGQRAALGDRCRFQLSGIEVLAKSDWHQSHFDKVVELGLGGHIVADQLVDHFEQVRRLLRPGGLYIYQGITRRMGGTWGSTSRFVDSFVLPIGELVPLSTLLEAAEQSGLEVRGVDSLQEPYLQALRSWLSRLQDRHREIACLAGEPVYRAWRLYLAATAYGLASRQLNVYEAVLHRPGLEANASSSRENATTRSVGEQVRTADRQRTAEMVTWHRHGSRRREPVA